MTSPAQNRSRSRFLPFSVMRPFASVAWQTIHRHALLRAFLLPGTLVVMVALSLSPAWAAPAATTTALTITSTGTAVTSVTAGTVVTLTATVPQALRP